MSSWAAELRRREAEQRREEREVRQRRKELDRRLQDLVKLSEWEQVRLEVEDYDNTLQRLLSFHKERSAPVKWEKYATSLPPHAPVRSGRYEFADAVRREAGALVGLMTPEIGLTEAARQRDEEEHQQSQEDCQARFAEWLQMRSLAQRVLAGQPQAYSEAIAEFSTLSDIEMLGSSVHFTVHSPRLLQGALLVNGINIIPAETKTLTVKGKLSVKATPKQRFQELYQDHVCSCLLRLAREVFALLPVSGVLLTASVQGVDNRTGNPADFPVLSVSIERSTFEKLNFDQLDPSDAVEGFVHRGDAKASQRSGEFTPIVPLTPQDLEPVQPERMDLDRLLTKVRQLRAEIEPLLKPVALPPEEASDTLPEQ